MIPNEENEKEGWHYLAVKTLFALLCRKTSNHDSSFYSLNRLHSFRTEKNSNQMKKHVEIKLLQYQNAIKKIKY